jgi:phosphatidylethanolamine/phosphatidyl-N-methylethanolamine N-methyltransferase
VDIVAEKFVALPRDFTAIDHPAGLARQPGIIDSAREPARYFRVVLVASSAKLLVERAATVSINGSRRRARGGVRAPTLADPLLFLRGWSRDPVAVGGPFASSFWTARRLAQATLDAAIPGGGPVLELGAGTGPITEALIATGCPVDQIVAVERDAELCGSLERRFSGLHVLQGDALQLGEILARARISSVRVVLSGLPMRVVPTQAAARCYSQAFHLMPSGGAIIQYTYGFRPPVDPADAVPKLDATFVGREWRNLPPMGIWSYRLAGAGPTGRRLVDDVGRHVQRLGDDVAGHRHHLDGGAGDTDRRRDNAAASKARGHGQDQHHA